MTTPTFRPVRDTGAFLAELAMLAGLAAAGVGLGGSTGIRIALAVVFPLVAAVLWGLWLAPRAGRRLPRTRRIVAKVALLAITGGLLVAAGHPVLGIAGFVVTTAVVTTAELTS
ncbi:hypothetical protein GCM10009836_19670 [Pseudonocardia ailaonensis]|uniref:DUF2568 domain-containing protein n=1 Tax=Pseudonocardia ailaonensis TaxID=367279 RepID=A0ABN2MX01_9PSEU